MHPNGNIEIIGSTELAKRSSPPSTTGSAIGDILAGRDTGVPRLEDALGQKRSDGRGQPAPTRIPEEKPPLGSSARTAVPIGTTADIGVLIKAARGKSGFTQQRFADIAGVGRRFISELEAGKPTLEFAKVIRCCLAAGIDIVAQPRDRS